MDNFDFEGLIDKNDELEYTQRADDYVIIKN